MLRIGLGPYQGLIYVGPWSLHGQSLTDSTTTSDDNNNGMYGKAPALRFRLLD